MPWKKLDKKWVPLFIPLALMWKNLPIRWRSWVFPNCAPPSPAVSLPRFWKHKPKIPKWSSTLDGRGKRERECLSISIRGSISNTKKSSNQPREISKRNRSEDAQISEHFARANSEFEKKIKIRVVWRNHFLIHSVYLWYTLFTISKSSQNKWPRIILFDDQCLRSMIL